MQKERDEATVKTRSRAPTQSHLCLLSLVSRAMARGSLSPVEANPLRGGNFGLENELSCVCGGECSITGSCVFSPSSRMKLCVCVCVCVCVHMHA